MDTRIPVTVVTGYLGAGKTSLVNHLLQTSGRRLAIIVNEFGDIGIDGDLIQSGDEELIELNSGCICCVVRGDLIRTLRGMLQRGGFDSIVIETTGLANPSPVVQTFYADQQLAAQCRLDAVVTVVDALHFGRQLETSKDAADQIALASLILLNKASEASDTGALQTSLRALNPFADIHQIDRGQADPGRVFDTYGFDLDRIRGLDLIGHRHRDHGPGGIRSVSLTAHTPIDAAALKTWLTDLLAVKGADILRTKGIVWAEGDDRKLVVQAVNMLMEGDFTSPWPGGEARESRLVFIGRNLDPEALRAGFLACRAPVTV